MEYALVAVAFLVLVCALPQPRKRWKSKLRVIGRKGKNYVRFYPNPGFTIRGFHWCKAKGRAKH